MVKSYEIGLTKSQHEQHGIFFCAKPEDHEIMMYLCDELVAGQTKCFYGPCTH
jgi:hypothetical protein